MKKPQQNSISMQTESLSEITCDLMIIGSGMAGMSAALYAAERKIDTVLAGMTSGMNFASGLMDLIGVHPVEKGRVRHNPWKAMDALRRDLSNHPYAKTDNRTIEEAFKTLLSFLSRSGLHYQCEGNRNISVIAPPGTIKNTYCIPKTMVEGSWALEKNSPALIVDFQGLKGFSARQIEQALKSRWPSLKSCRLKFPGSRGELFAESMGRMLELPEKREQLASLIETVKGDAHAVGMPAVLGITGNEKVYDDLRARIGLPLFEIPIMPPSITGLRLMEIFDDRLPRMGVKIFRQYRVDKAGKDDSGDFLFEISRQENHCTIKAKGAILATGRFFGRGLRAEREKITETVFGLPVYQDENRENWYRKIFLDPRGHPINRFGLEIDRHFRPIDSKGRPVYKNLFAAGSILAHQDWVRMKCGTGLAISTAFAAVGAFAKALSAL